MTDAPPFFDVSHLSLNRAGEELCGDQVKILRPPTRTIVVLSDGLGSGVKANILARLTTGIIVTMIRAEAPLEDVIETVLGTLPVCKVRQIACATFLVVEIQNATGKFRVVNFDRPSPFFFHKARAVPLETRQEIVQDKQLRLSAGMGTLYNFGWGRPQVQAHLENTLRLRNWSADAVVGGGAAYSRAKGSR